MKKIKKIWKTEKITILLIAMNLFLFVSLLQAIQTINEYKIMEQLEICYEVPEGTPTAEEND